MTGEAPDKAAVCGENNDQRRSERVTSLQPAGLTDSDVAKAGKRVQAVVKAMGIIFPER